MTTHTLNRFINSSNSTTSAWVKWALMLGVYCLVMVSFMAQITLVRTAFDISNPADLVQRALAYEAYGDYNNAILDYQSAIALDSTHAPAYLQLAKLYDRWQLWDDAVVMYRLYLDYASVPDTMVMARLDVLQ